MNFWTRSDRFSDPSNHFSYRFNIFSGGMFVLQTCRPKQFAQPSPDLFACRFQEGNSFPNFVERSILKLPLSKLCCVLCPLLYKNRALLEGGEEGEVVPRNASKRGQTRTKIKSKNFTPFCGSPSQVLGRTRS